MRAQEILTLPKWEPGAQNIAALRQNLPVLTTPRPIPIVNDRSPIVSSEFDAAHPCVTISFYKKPTNSLFFCAYDHH